MFCVPNDAKHKPNLKKKNLMDASMDFHDQRCIKNTEKSFFEMKSLKLREIISDHGNAGRNSCLYISLYIMNAVTSQNAHTLKGQDLSPACHGQASAFFSLLICLFNNETT